MQNGPEIDLDRNNFRSLPRGPFGNPRDLWLVVAFWLGMAVVGAGLAVNFGTFWAALLPIPFAVGAGIGLAALFPSRFFGPSRQ